MCYIEKDPSIADPSRILNLGVNEKFLDPKRECYKFAPMKSVGTDLQLE